MTEKESKVLQLGGHRMWFEEPDTLVFEVHGELTDEHAKGGMAELATLATGKRYLFVLIDVRGYASISPGARRAFAQEAGVMPPLVSVYFGASFRARVMAELLFAVVNVLGRQRHRYRICDTEADARSYLAEIRPSYAGAK